MLTPNIYISEKKKVLGVKRLATGLKNIAFAVTNLEKMNCVPSVRSINPATARVWPVQMDEV